MGTHRTYRSNHVNKSVYRRDTPIFLVHAFGLTRVDNLFYNAGVAINAPDDDASRTKYIMLALRRALLLIVAVIGAVLLARKREALDAAMDAREAAGEED